MAPSLWTAGPGGVLEVRPHRGQWRAWCSRRRFIWMLAGTQGGKTSFGPLWLWREIQARGPGDYLAVTATYPLLKLKMLPEFLRLFRDTLHLGRWFAGERVFRFSGGETRVIFGSGINPGGLESATAKAAWLDECGQDDFRLESWEAVQRRLSLNEGRVLGGTTLYNLGWLKRAVYDAWRGGDRDHDVIQFESVVNPAFPRREYERARRVLPAWKFRMMYGGQFDRPAGLIYGDFVDRYREEGGHRVRAFDVPAEWPRYVGVDFGAVNTARLVVAEDPEARVWYVISESVEGGRTSGEHAAAALAAVAGTNIRTWHGGSASEVQQRLDWGAGGVPVQGPVVVDVEAGIDRVVGLWRTARLYVFDSCVGLLEELGMYRRVVDEFGNPTEVIRDPRSYHRLDALRYVVQGLEGGLWFA